MLELAGLLSRKLLVTPGQEGFEGKLVEDTVIWFLRLPLVDVTRGQRSASPAVVLAWRQGRPDDDGLHQEFYIDIDNGDGRISAVRLVQRCETDHIAYF